jgi:hypothetical protein
MPIVTFQFSSLLSGSLDSEVTPRLKVTPYYSPVFSASAIIPSDPIETDLVNNTASLSNLIPNIYTAELWTSKKETEFKFIVPTNSTGSFNATSVIVAEWTGSQDTDAVRIVALPANTGSTGQRGYMAFDSGSVWVYGTGSVWQKLPITVW